MNPGGLHKGFLRFGTAAHRVLVALHESGEETLCTRDLRRETGLSEGALSMALIALKKSPWGFLFSAGKTRIEEFGAQPKVMQLWSLRPPAEPAKYKRLSTKERTKRYRSNKKMRVSDVFHFRSRIRLDQTCAQRSPSGAARTTNQHSASSMKVN